MKRTKVLFVSLILVLGLASTTIITTQLYTKEQVSTLGSRIGYNAFWHGSLDLGSLLTINYNYDLINEETGENNWRNMLAANPTLAYTAVDLYSTDFLEGFEEGFEEGKLEYISQMNDQNKQAENSSAIYKKYDYQQILARKHDNYLRLSLGNIRKYNNLIDDLLKLDDSKLNSLVNSISGFDWEFLNDEENNEILQETSSTEAKELKRWLVSNGYITSVEHMNFPGMPYHTTFPTDVILLTRRISSSYPDWTNRRTLEEMKKFSVHVQKKLQVD